METAIFRRVQILLVFSALGFAICQSGCREAKPGQIHVLVATSLAEEIRQLATEFENESGPPVVVVSGSSNSLARQILSGSPADVYISAHPLWHQELKDGGLEFRESHDIAGNRLCLVAVAGNPCELNSAQDLLENRVKRIALGGANVPVGEYARQYLASAGLESVGNSRKVIFASNAATVAMWLERGEVDAAFVYASDVTSQMHVVSKVSASLHDPILYTAGVISQDPPSGRAQEFVDFLSQSRAKKLFESSGFSVDMPVAGSNLGD